MTEQVLNRPIGIIGLGDLGGKLTAQELLSGNRVMAFDSNPKAEPFKNAAIDPRLNASEKDMQLFRTASIEHILQDCRIVHWAVASRYLDSLPIIPNDCIVVLHDSVMNNSLTALSNRIDKQRFVIAHCLMNDRKRVLISTESDDFLIVQQHFKSVGLSPRSTTIKEHDTIMARSQGVFALLIRLGIRDELDKAFIAGNLTPSAMELREAVINRETNWTKETIESILSNPQLLPFVRDMRDMLTTISERDSEIEEKV